MNLRITPGFSVDQAIQRSQGLRQQLEVIRAKMTSNKKYLRASEAPDQIIPRASLRSAIRQIDSDLTNAGTARSRINHSITILSDVRDLLTEAKSRSAEASLSSERELLATQIDVLLANVIGLANSSFDGEYLFAGAANQAEPFVAVTDSASSRIVGVTYQGSRDPGQVLIQGEAVDIRYAGSGVFQPRRTKVSANPVGNTGLQLGKGVGSATGVLNVEINHTGTTYTGTSGVATGASSLGGDTIVGALGTHRLEIQDLSGTGASGTVSLNGGAPVAFTSADVDLQVMGPTGEVVYVNTSSISAGFFGTVDVQANATLSIDGGATSYAVTFSNDQVVANADGSSMVNLDSTNVRRSGDTLLDLEGTADLFQTLIQLREDLRNSGSVGEASFAASMSRRQGDIQRHIDNIAATIGGLSVTDENLLSVEERSSDIKLRYQESLASIEDADLITLALELQNQQTQLQFSLAAMSSLFDISLLNFMQ